MYINNIIKLQKALLLKYPPVGVKLLTYKQEYDNMEIDEFENKASFCYLVKKAMEGKPYKASSKDFSCTAGAEALGVKESNEETLSGRTWYASGMYCSRAISKNIIDESNHLEEKSYGVAISTFDKLSDADMVIILCNSKQAMRIFQGYAMFHGTPNNLSTVGFQAICCDLFSKPFMNNDINFSFMCSGARSFMGNSDDELGIAFPPNLLDSITTGVIETINLVERQPFKTELEENISPQEDLGITIDIKAHYSKNTAKYRRYVQEMELNEL